MENSWILYALAALLFSWMGWFMKKLALAKWLNKEVYLLACFVIYVPVFTINMLLQWDRNFSDSLLFSWVIMGFLNFLIPLWTLTSLKYLEVWFALVTTRITSSVILLIIGVFMLGDQLSLYNYIGFVVGASAIFLLSGFKPWQKTQLPIKWVIAVIWTIIAVALSHAYFKYIVADINIHDFVFLQFVVTFLCIILYMTLRRKFHHVTVASIRKTFLFSFSNVVVYVVYVLYLLPNVYLLGPLSLGYKILSYSVIVPVILSWIFLWESMTKTKLFALWLTVVSIFLFLI